LNAKSLVGRIPIGCIWQSPFLAKRCFPRTHRSDLRSKTNNTTTLSSFGTILCELGALARNPLLAVLVASRVPESHRKGAKGDSHASNSKLLVDSKKSESGSFPERTTVDDLPTSWSVFLRVSASPWLASAVFGWIAA